ncbi:PREDICTED: uncharacterized protein LOC106804700 isoform X2 [Priapulus caudatus]|uniref:Uncharacterized protein LOC106804700 isoform X2 n=1 Tax=Priapulus caudatus TaxID=37621 RepID=A0ABM1DNF3_PRICU|nr:PREDICTED: uncharacterized protein LOC106804700 isoform X2 [Priapulus caudatus]
MRKYTKRSTAAAALLNLAGTPREPSDATSEPGTSDTPQATSSTDSTFDNDPNKACETLLTMKDIEGMESTTRQLLVEKHDLQGKVDDLKLSEESFRVNNEKVKVFTGLANFNLLMTVFNLIRPNLKDKSSLSPFDQLLLTLMRLRLNVTVQYLSFVFSVHHSTIVRAFSDVIHVLNEKFVPLTVVWADRAEVRSTLPYVFKKTFSKCVSIIDCFEIFLERPSNLDSKAKTYSNYKSHDTIKYLISMAPQGYVNFISKGWGGRTSDRQLTERCGYLPNLVPGDTVLADRGFTIQDLVASYGASLEIPAFTRGKAQLDKKEVNETRHLASVRIHIERVIGNIRKKYPILGSTIPITLLQTDEISGFTTLDKVVRVACGLSDICESIVPFH